MKNNLRSKMRYQSLFGHMLGFVGIISVLFTPSALAGKSWQGTVPKFAADPQKWENLIVELQKNNLNYGAFFGSQRALLYFDEIKIKQLAYRTIVENISLGYPFPVKKYFVSGDLDLRGDGGFEQMYNFYKGSANTDEKMDAWAENYFSKLDRKNFPRYRLFEALKNYNLKKFEEAKQILKDLLKEKFKSEDLPFMRTVARTLARIHYEQGEYVLSGEIYQQFLLQQKNITPTDWLEYAWNLFNLKEYNLTLGALYNLQSHNMGSLKNLEKYILRALVYQSLCAEKTLVALKDNFNADWLTSVKAIKEGKPLDSLATLEELGIPDEDQGSDYASLVAHLNAEASQLEDFSLSQKQIELAKYLYSSQRRQIKTQFALRKQMLLEKVADYMVSLNESIAFLESKVKREQINPDRVFKNTKVSKSKDFQIAGLNADAPLILWPQEGVFWRDERLKFKAKATDLCPK